MTRFKDFGSGTPNTDLEPLTFKLHGEEFSCVPQIPGKLLIDLVQESQSGDTAKSAGIITRFFNQVLEDESVGRFNELLDDKHRVVTVDTLAQITSWLVEEYTNRPEGQQEVSLVGESTSGLQ